MSRVDPVEFAAAEPPNGTVLVLDKGLGEWHVVYRDDEHGSPAAENERWFAARDEVPSSLHDHLSYGDIHAVYALGEKLAQF